MADAPVNWLGRLSAVLRERRKQAQQESVHTKLMQVCVRLDEARRYVDRDRAAERRERDRLILQRQAARDRLAEFEELLRGYLQGQAIIDAEAAAGRAREALASDFGALG